MALTRDFQETIAARVQTDPAFARVLLDEALALFFNNEPDTAKLILRDLVNATIGFESLAEDIHKPNNYGTILWEILIFELWQSNYQAAN